MAEVSFVTVAITYRQPETAVILSMFEAYGIPAYALGADTVRANASWTMALGGIRIRVPREHAEEARAMPVEAAERETEQPRDPLEARIGDGLLSIVLMLLGGALMPPKLGPTILDAPAGR